MTEAKRTTWLDNFQNRHKRPAESQTEAPAKRRDVLKPTQTLSSSTKAPVILQTDSAGDSVCELTGRIVKFLSGRGAQATVQFQTTDDRLLILTNLKILPVVDKGFQYHVKVRRAASTGTAKMEITAMLEPAIVALPVNGAELREKLWHGLKMQPADATRIAMQVAEPFLDPATSSIRHPQRLRSVQIPVEHLFENYSNEEWFHKLGGSWKPIQFRNFPLLCKFWSYWELHEMHLDELQHVASELARDPLPWFLAGQTDTGLSPIAVGKAHLLPQLLGVSLTPENLKVITYYNSIYNQFDVQKSLCLFKTHIASIASSLNQQERQAILNQITTTTGMSEERRKANYNLLTITYEPGFGAGYYHRKADYANKLTIKRRLGFIMTKDPAGVETNARFAAIELTPEQSVCVTRIVSRQNIMLLVGDAGTGKTHVGRAVFNSFLPKAVLPLAMYGEVANKMRRVYGKGMTIDMCLERIRRGTRLGCMLRDTTEVLIIDEIGVVTEDKFAGLLRAFPNVKKIFMMGDFKQLRPVSAGPVLESLMRKWTGTPLVQVLERNHRVDENSLLLLSNFRAYINGDIKSIQYTNSYLGDNPFHVIQRINYPDACVFPDAGDLANHNRRMLIMKSELEPIRAALIEQGKELHTVRILAQRSDDVAKLNQAWFMLENADKNVKYSDNVFYKGSLVCFQKNMNFKKYDWTQQVACSPVSNNTTGRIKEIFDVNPRTTFTKAMATRKDRDSTADKKFNEKWVRVIIFEDGMQINLRDYPLRWLAYGYATTVASSIGSECKTVIGWIQPQHVHVYRETLYTLMTRASETVYLICDFNGDPTLHNSDIGWIYRKPAPEVENILVNYLPEYGQASELLAQEDEPVAPIRHVFPRAHEIKLNGMGFEMSDSDDNDDNWNGDDDDELVQSASNSNIGDTAMSLFDQAEQGAFRSMLTNSRTETYSSQAEEFSIYQINSNW